jgi:sphinganine-1-phosphate aldolase
MTSAICKFLTDITYRQESQKTIFQPIFDIRLIQQMIQMTSNINGRLSGYSPLQVATITTIGVLTLQQIVNRLQPCWGESRREQLGRWAAKIPFIQREYSKDFQKQLNHFCLKTQEKWKAFGPPILKIPEEGWSDEMIFALLEKYVQITQKAVQGKYFSGTIYSKSLLNEAKTEMAFAKAESIQETSDPFAQLSLRLKKIFTKTFEETYLWNMLHSNEFGIGAFASYQVVRMLADLFGAKPEDVMGSVTTGGTETLLKLAKAYRNWGMKTKGIPLGECVILAGESIHAALHKAASAYHIRLVMAKTDKFGNIDMDDLNRLANRYGNKVVAIFGSTPSYSKGKVDAIEEMGTLALRLGCGLHVDTCLGGLIINYQENINSEFLKIPGVTSLSVDMHKNGWAPKGAGGVSITKYMPEGQNLAYYSIFSLPDWDGGPYGTEGDPGSEPCAKALFCLFALLTIGQNGYQTIGEAVLSTTKALGEKISNFEGKLKLLGEPDVNVVAFAVDKKWGLEDGATYALAHLMSEKGFVLNTIKGDAAHFCVTGRCIGEDRFLQDFEKALEKSLTELEELNTECKQTGQKFPGDAGVYCALDAAITPNRQKLGTINYIKNILLGIHGAHDAVRAHFLALLNPYDDTRSSDFVLYKDK